MQPDHNRRHGRPSRVIDPICTDSTFVTPLPEGCPIGALPPCEQAAMLWRWEYCQRFLRMERAGLADQTDAYMSDAIGFIEKRLRTDGYQEIHLQPLWRKLRGGMPVTILNPPDPAPAELRLWLDSVEAGDLTVLADRSRCELRGDAHPHDPPAPPPGPVTQEELDGLSGRWLTREEARRFMPATVAVLRALIDSELIPSKEFTDKPGVISCTMLKGEDVLDYRRTFASLALLGKEAGIHPPHLLKRIDAASIGPAFNPDVVGTRIYRRSEVLAQVLGRSGPDTNE